MKKEIIIETETADERSAIAKGSVYVGFEMGFKHAVELLNHLAYEEKIADVEELLGVLTNECDKLAQNGAELIVGPMEFVFMGDDGRILH